MQLLSILIFAIYQIIQIILLPLLPIYLLIRKIKNKPAFGNPKERIGLVPKNKNIQNTIWIHAVSVGEILSIQNLIDQIKEKNKNICCYVTTGTITGKKIAIKNLNADYISFLPYDFLIPMFLAFKRIKPKSLIIVEAETWPNLIFIARWLKIKTFLINARISKRSEKKYFLFKFLFKNILQKFKLILTQSKKDKDLFTKLDIDKNKIKILGNIKTLNVLAKKNKIKPATLINEFPTLLIGSIHAGELDTYLELYKKLKNDFKNLKLIIAPRHFYWKNELIKKIKINKFKFFLWDKENQINKYNSNLIEFVNKIFTTNDVLLVCKLGELFNLYKITDIFFLGGTFVNIGGHNLLEPAVWAKTSIIGPYYQNCKDVADKLEKVGGIIKVKNFIQLYKETSKLLKNRVLKEKRGENSYDWLKQEAFYVQKNINNLIKKL
ncbi:hypothetical protein GF385_02005 [Candidatus Dependentiae bacterium]|nr:hypothetical protein [Candidatus Dependentiae bacterium]